MRRAMCWTSRDSSVVRGRSRTGISRYESHFLMTWGAPGR
jgi:hypothetical protein